MKRDLYSGLAAALALAPAVHSAAAGGYTIDVSQAGGVVFVVSTGAIAGAGDFGAKVQESENGTDWTDAPAKRVKAPLVPATLAQNVAYRIGYYGKARYARLALTKAGGTSIAAGAVAVLRPLDRPVP